MIKKKLVVLGGGILAMSVAIVLRSQGIVLGGTRQRVDESTDFPPQNRRCKTVDIDGKMVPEAILTINKTIIVAALNITTIFGAPKVY